MGQQTAARAVCISAVNRPSGHIPLQEIMDVLYARLHFPPVFSDFEPDERLEIRKGIRNL